jgi:DnaJ-class molecular chaperone
MSVGKSLPIGRFMPMPKPGKKKPKCENCEGKGLIKLGDKKVKCQRCGGTGYQARPIATG